MDVIFLKLRLVFPFVSVTSHIRAVPRTGLWHDIHGISILRLVSDVISTRAMKVVE